MTEIEKWCRHLVKTGMSSRKPEWDDIKFYEHLAREAMWEMRSRILDQVHTQPLRGKLTIFGDDEAK